MGARGATKVLGHLGGFAAAYLAASAVETVFWSEWRGGHADIPFTMFPDYLVFAPVLPGVVLRDLVSSFGAREVVSTLVFLAVFAPAMAAFASVRARRSRSARSSRPADATEEP